MGGRVGMLEQFWGQPEFWGQAAVGTVGVEREGRSGEWRSE